MHTVEKVTGIVTANSKTKSDSTAVHNNMQYHSTIMNDSVRRVFHCTLFHNSLPDFEGVLKNQHVAQAEN
jgi:hypothetical protein